MGQKYLVEVDDLGNTTIYTSDEIDKKEIPSIFNAEQYMYATALHEYMTLNGLKGEILNVLEGIGLSEKQERAIKRTITNILHQFAWDYRDSLDLVIDPNEYPTEEEAEKMIQEQL